MFFVIQKDTEKYFLSRNGRIMEEKPAETESKKKKSVRFQRNRFTALEKVTTGKLQKQYQLIKKNWG